MANPAVHDIKINCDLASLPRVEVIPGALIAGDRLANRIAVRVTKGGQPVTVQGTVRGYVVKPDGTVITGGSGASQNMVYFTLPVAALTQPGTLLVFIKTNEGTASTTLAACRCVVHPA